MFELSIGAVVKNEALYLPHWIEFHLLQGVQHFYIVEGGSIDHTLQVLHEYQKLGILTYISDPKFILDNQMMAYNQILDEFGAMSRQIAFIDVDEYLYAYNQSLVSFLRKLGPYGALAVHWKIFGSNGELLYTPHSVVERFTRREVAVNKHVKSIVMTANTKRAGKDPHVFRVSTHIIDENRNILGSEYALSTPATASKIAINHYCTKSKQEFTDRRHRIATPQMVEASFKSHDKNELEDTYLVQFEPEIAVRLEKRNHD